MAPAFISSAVHDIAAICEIRESAQGRGDVAQNAASHVKKLKIEGRADRPLDHAMLTPLEITRLIVAADAAWRAALNVLLRGASTPDPGTRRSVSRDWRRKA